MNIWFSSDFHYGQKNIVYGESSWEDKEYSTRKFNTLEEHNSKLIENINNVCKENDILYFMGDWSFGGKENVPIFRKALNIKTIHFIGGNHDDHIRENIYAQNFFSSYNELIEKKIGGQRTILCHYPLRVWHKGSRGAWMLHGHCHGNLPQYKNYKTMDVGIDTHKEFRPYHIDEIRTLFSNCVDLNVDHHKNR